MPRTRIVVRDLFYFIFYGDLIAEEDSEDEGASHAHVGEVFAMASMRAVCVCVCSKLGTESVVN